MAVGLVIYSKATAFKAKAIPSQGQELTSLASRVGEVKVTVYTCRPEITRCYLCSVSLVLVGKSSANFDDCSIYLKTK